MQETGPDRARAQLHPNCVACSPNQSSSRSPAMRRVLEILPRVAELGLHKSTFFRKARVLGIDLPDEAVARGARASPEPPILPGNR
jgi:hypothetical protein